MFVVDHGPFIVLKQIVAEHSFYQCTCIVCYALRFVLYILIVNLIHYISSVRSSNLLSFTSNLPFSTPN